MSGGESTNPGGEKFADEVARMGDDYFFAHITSTSTGIGGGEYPEHVSGLSVVLLVDGRISLEVNGAQLDLSPISIMVLGPGSVVRIQGQGSGNLDAYLLYLSVGFLRDINIDLNAFRFRSLMEAPRSPVIDNLSDPEISILMKYMDLLCANASINGRTIYSRNIGCSITQALIYQLMQIHTAHADDTEPITDSSLSRKLAYVREFMDLVKKHHTSERNISFYADKMFISPKYLSRIVKDATGRSAAAWIDQFVLVEAKNMLRYTNRNVQQVAYALNFASQSSFGKFFKHLTGMSPSRYQQG